MSRIATWEMLMANCLRLETVDTPDLLRHKAVARRLADKAGKLIEMCGTDRINGQRTFTMLADAPKLLADIAAGYPDFDPLGIRFSFWRESDPARQLSGVVVLECGEQLLAKDAEEIREMLFTYRTAATGTPQRQLYDDFLTECFDLLCGTNTLQPALAGGVRG